ncbi:uncharacterized protein M6B38_333160 [Iris pallida]|uniref:GYF domain-containing protein n=1 Tax=Iris pallida TaxID=29817 RepID=A0AAX6H2Z6_IRIPA|nr:uncharacterized protein M6B38_333160 [Iris pallida]
MGDYKDEGSDNIRGEQPSYMESPSYERTSSQHSMPWRSPLAGERTHESSRDCQDFSTEPRARKSEFDWLHSQRSLENDQKNGLVPSPYFRDESQWHNSDLNSEMSRDSKIKRLSSEVLDLEKEGTLSHGQEDPFITRDKSSAAKFPPYPSPEELALFYKDPQGRIQGPFSGTDLIGWFEAGYFGIDLQVRLASAPPDAPFALLGDVMPHLRAKARPPPGFGVAKQNEVAEVSTRGNFNSVANAHFAMGELEAVKNVQRNRHEAVTDAENRFIESLMSGHMSKSSSEHYSVAEGMQGYGLPSVGGESMKDMNYLLAQRMSLETQRSLPTSVSYWPGRDGSPMVSKSDIIPESLSQHAKFLPPLAEVPRQIPPQQVDFLSLLQAAADKSTSPAVNSAVPVRPSFPEFQSPNNLFHGGIDIIKDRIDLQQNQHITSQTGFGAQQQRLHQQNKPSLMQILTQPGDLSSAVVPPEKLLAPEISQDPQMINLLQQQYLMSQIQLQSQSPLPSHLSLLDKYLLLKQQQQKQEQQQQQLLLQQQQHLLSQVLSGHPSRQLFAEPSFGHLKASVPAGNTSMDHLGLCHMYESLQNNQQVPGLTSLDGHAPTTLSPNVQAPVDASHTVSTGPPHPMLPHEMFGHNIQPKEWDPSPLQEPSSCLNSVPQPDLPKSDGLFLSETMQNNAQEAFIEQKSIVEDKGKQQNLEAISYAATGKNMVSIHSASIDGLVSAEVAESSEVISSVSEQVDDMKISSDIIREASVAKEVGMQEVKKPSERKSKKQKKPKAQLISDLVEGSSKITDNQPQLKPDCETERANIGGRKVEIQMKIEPTYSSLPLKTGVEHSVASADESFDFPPAQVFSSPTISTDKVNILEKKSEHGEDGMSLMSSQATSSNRAWKPAPGFKPKSLLEIQLEEQHRVQRERIVSETSAPVILPSSPTPRVGVTNSYNQHDKDFSQTSSSTQIAWRSEEYPSTSLNNRKSQLHDLLAEEVLAKSNEGGASFPDEKGSSLDFLPEVSVQAEVSSVVDDFVEAKDTKKSRRKAAKAKAAGLKASSPVASAYLSTPLIPTERGKSTSQVQQDKELLPVPPAGPSLGDFVFWKGDQTNSSPAPAWSSELAKIKKGTSLREIQKEQEKINPSVQQQIPIPTPAKVQPSRSSQGGGSSWPVPGSSPSKTASAIQTKVASPVQTSSHAFSQSKSRTEDDLFWGPLDHLKQETKQSDFPSLANPSRRGGKDTPVKGTPVISITRQKLPSGRAADHPISTSPLTGQSFSKGKKDEGSKHSGNKS